MAEQEPVGQAADVQGRTIEVVGIVRDIKGRNLFESPGPMFYLPLLQSYQPHPVLHVRTTRCRRRGYATLRNEVRPLDNDLPVYDVKTLDEHLTATLTPQRLLAHLVTGFGVLALLLAGIGLYASAGAHVSERTPEIGLRMALGAHKRDVVRMFMTAGHEAGRRRHLARPGRGRPA